MSNTPSCPLNPNRVGFAGFQAYGDVPGAHGPWKTYDGRDMPTWDAVGPATQARWVAAGEAERRAVLERVRTFGAAGIAIAAAIEGRTLMPSEQATLSGLMTAPPERVSVVPHGQKPSIGRAVHYQHGDLVCAADITAVNSDGSVSLLVKPPNENPYPVSMARQATTEAPMDGCWNWMPRV
ncbi:hypothetical protein HI113_38580 [Corallococcus exiguus]|uniref:hypothetical protein n=1 Tax=Corallococcus exiguus TaxID=83462 RepID=UPI0014756A07|nr:hypothetical protein [Corallococcus exiguus]NNB99803.1 hypothetical protein [Corallococcus exiguus]